MGTRKVFRIFLQLRRDHPHAYGDKDKKISYMTSYLGSSPRVWGQVTVMLTELDYKRIIPTRMGTSVYPDEGDGDNRDHPHAYGDKESPNMKKLKQRGSSPRVWGQVCSFIYCRTIPGIIPTRMGTRYHLLIIQKFHWDHPHAYGDKLSKSDRTEQSLGSSPRVWGQVTGFNKSCEVTRIIPTRMGTRKMTKKEDWEAKDHPHAYGDKSIWLFQPKYFLGSSPRVWGQGIYR